MPDGQPRDASLGVLLSRLSAQFTQLVRQEIALAKSEIAEEARKAQRTGALFAAAAAVGAVAALLLASAVAWGLAEILPPGVAFLIVGAILGAVAVAAFLRAKRSAEELDPVPEQTMETLKEDAQWLKEHRP